MNEKEEREIREASSKKIIFTNRDYKKIVNRHIKIFKRKKFDFIFAIFAGALPLGAHLKNVLKIPFKIVLPEPLTIFPFEHTEYTDANVLLIDDICDSGKTFQSIVQNLKSIGIMNITTFCLVQKSDSLFTCDYSGFEHKGTEWVVFPWEK